MVDEEAATYYRTLEEDEHGANPTPGPLRRPRTRPEGTACCAVCLTSITFIFLFIYLIIYLFTNMAHEEVVESHACPPALAITELTHGRRSVHDFMRSADDAVCDDWVEQRWYVFNVSGSNQGDIMPEKPPLPGYCNSEVPFWFYGVHPDRPSGPQVAVACGVYMGHSCYFYANIRVQNCGSHMVYFLQALPRCFMAYCAQPMFFSNTPPSTRSSNFTPPSGSVSVSSFTSPISPSNYPPMPPIKRQ